MPSPAADPQAAPSRRPNLVVVMADQLRRCSTGFRDGSLAQTPMLDALAAEGSDFVEAVSNKPLCDLSRGVSP
jgi:arylsulfatase A-like enzyme